MNSLVYPENTVVKSATLKDSKDESNLVGLSRISIMFLPLGFCVLTHISKSLELCSIYDKIKLFKWVSPLISVSLSNPFP